MGAFALPLAIAAAGFQAYSSYSDAQSQKATAEAQAQISRNNAIVANNNATYQEKQAGDALQQGRDNATALRRKLSVLTGAQNAAYAGAGVSLDTGSPLDVLTDTTSLASGDIKKTFENADKTAFGYRMGAYNSRAQGGNFSAQGNLYDARADSIDPLMSAAGSALSSAGNISSKWDSLSTPASASGSGGFAPTEGPFDNSLPWRNIPTYSSSGYN